MSSGQTLTRVISRVPDPRIWTLRELPIRVIGINLVATELKPITRIDVIQPSSPHLIGQCHLLKCTEDLSQEVGPKLVFFKLQMSFW